MRTSTILPIFGLLFIPTQLIFFLFTHGDVWPNYVVSQFPDGRAQQEVSMVALGISFERATPLILAPLTIALFICGWITHNRFALLFGLLLPAIFTLYTLLIYQYANIHHQLTLNQLLPLAKRYAAELMFLGTGSYLGYLASYLRAWKRSFS